MKPFDGRFLPRTVHPLDLAVGPGVGGLGEALLNAPLVAELPKRVPAQVGMMGHVSKLNAVVSQHFVNPAGNAGQHPFQKGHGDGLEADLFLGNRLSLVATATKGYLLNNPLVDRWPGMASIGLRYHFR